MLNDSAVLAVRGGRILEILYKQAINLNSINPRKVASLKPIIHLIPNQKIIRFISKNIIKTYPFRFMSTGLDTKLEDIHCLVPSQEVVNLQ